MDDSNKLFHIIPMPVMSYSLQCLELNEFNFEIK